MCEIVEAMMIACEMEKKRKLFYSSSCCVFVQQNACDR